LCAFDEKYDANSELLKLCIYVSFYYINIPCVFPEIRPVFSDVSRQELTHVHFKMAPSFLFSCLILVQPEGRK